MSRFLFLFFVLPALGFCQHKVKLKVVSSSFQLYTNYLLKGTDSIRLDQFKFYVGNQHGNYQLVDASDTTTYSLPFTDKELLIGMDSLANTLGKLDGAFDPLLGMYWAWNTGYIQLKVVGHYVTTQSSIPFEYHIGGYRSPYATSFPLHLPHEHAEIQIQLTQFFLNLPMLTTPKIMLPGSAAQQIFNSFAGAFR